MFLLHIILCNCKTLHYKISPDDPGGPIYIREQGINDTFIFQFEKFNTNRKYQIILSYPGYLPIICESNITQQHIYHYKQRIYQKHDNIELKSIKHDLRRRRLLDTNIESFITGNTAIEQTVINIIVRCKPIDNNAFDEMISSGAASKLMRNLGHSQNNITQYIVHFAIKIESLWFGIIPNSLIGLLIAVIVICVIIILWIAPIVLRNIIQSKYEYKLNKIKCKPNDGFNTIGIKTLTKKKRRSKRRMQN